MNKDILRRMIQTILTLALQGMILFVSAWSIRWVWALGLCCHRSNWFTHKLYYSSSRSD